MAKREPYYYKTTDTVSSADRREEQGVVYYVIEFEEGITIALSETKYKQAHAPKKGDEYTIIMSNRGNVLLKNYPEGKGKPRKDSPLRIRPQREYKSTRGIPV